MLPALILLRSGSKGLLSAGPAGPAPLMTVQSLHNSVVLSNRNCIYGEKTSASDRNTSSKTHRYRRCRVTGPLNGAEIDPFRRTGRRLRTR